jgi:class 3 adenylate cyclase
VSEARILLVDREKHTASMLADELDRRGYGPILQSPSVLDVPALAGSVADVVILNYHADQPDSLAACGALRAMIPGATIVALASPGPAAKAVRAWAGRSGDIDVIVEKPLAYDRFCATLAGLLGARDSSRKLESKAQRLSMLVPEGALPAAENDVTGEGELFEAGVLFTDIRGSSQLIRSMPPREFFSLLNEQLSEHARLIERHEGSVIKYTGDGVMAIFRGMGRSHLGLRCALQLAASGASQRLPYGVGVAQGLVLAGLIGDSRRAGQRRQFDVVGATVHLSARLCSLAEAGDVVTTASLSAAAKLASPAPRRIGRVSIKGFDDDVDCVAYGPAGMQSGAIT